MTATSKLILGRQLRPVRIHCQESRVRLSPRAEAFWLWAGKVLGGWCDGIAAYCRARQ